MQDKVSQIRDEALLKIAKTETLAALEEARVALTGKNSELTSLLKSLGTLTAAERPQLGASVNAAKQAIEQALAERRAALQQSEQVKKIAAEKVDITLPGRGIRGGRLHPLTQVMTEAKAIFIRLGFEIAEGPEVETDYYNFDGLNIPPHHPSRDMWATFFVNDDVLLRTHTSPVQIRVMEKRKPPLAIIPTRPIRRSSSSWKVFWSIKMSPSATSKGR
jgi:phenylalanyl-tRNA synthetase alpha chain